MNELNKKNDFILSRAEEIINQYIKEHRLTIRPDRSRIAGRRFSRFKLSVNIIINIILIAALVFLLLVISRLA